MPPPYKTSFNIVVGCTTGVSLTYSNFLNNNRMVYVLSHTGSALMPTQRHGKVRRLLRDGLAHVITRTPFTIQLDYESTEFTQPVTLGVDPGSTHVGLSATTDTKELFSAEVTLRTDIVKLLSQRREARRTRRSRLRYRAPRFNNRRRAESTLAPSVENRVQAHLRLIGKVRSILPVTRTVIEVAQFDQQLLKNPDISGEQYQQGEQMGFWNTREYVLCRDGHKCQHCKGKSKNPVLNVHHIESRQTGGDAPNNLITLCETCHKAYHKGGRLKRNQAPYLVHGFRLFDKVLLNGRQCFIFGRRLRGNFNVRTIYDVLIHSDINFKKLMFLEVSRRFLITLKREPIRFPIPTEVGSTLG